MLTIDGSIPCDDQPIDGATILGESRYLTSWVTPDNLEIQEKYKVLTANIASQKDRITALWNYVKGIPYTPFVHSATNIGGVVFKQNDTWLNPAQALQVRKLNCMNKATLLTSLLRQEFSPNEAYVCLGNVNVDGIDGHAVSYLRWDSDYLLETTNPGIQSPFLRAENMDIYESVMFFNDKGVSRVPNVSLREPLGLCCVSWLEGYINQKLCTEYV